MIMSVGTINKIKNKFRPEFAAKLNFIILSSGQECDFSIYKPNDCLLFSGKDGLTGYTVISDNGSRYGELLMINPNEIN